MAASSDCGLASFHGAMAGLYRRPEDGCRKAPAMTEPSRPLSASHAVETDSETEGRLRVPDEGACHLSRGLRPKCTID